MYATEVPRLMGQPPRTRGHFQSKAEQTRISHVVGGFQVVKEALTLLSELGCNFRQPDDCLHCLNLTEKRPDARKIVVAPVLQEPGRGRCHPPRVRLLNLTPAIDVVAQFVDNRRRIVLLLLRGQSQTFIEDHSLLLTGTSLLLWLRNRSEKLYRPPTVQNPLSRLAMFIQFPVPRRVFIR